MATEPPLATPDGGAPQALDPHRRRSLAAGVFLTTFFLVMALGGATPPQNDGKQIFAHAEAVVYQRHFGVQVRPGVLFYNPRPFLVSLIHVPDVALRRVVSGVFPAADALTRVLTSHIVPAALTALTALLFMRFVLGLGVGALGATVSTLLLVLGTMLLVYGRVVWSDVFQAAAFWGFFSEVLRTARRPDRRGALRVGAWAGLLVNTKVLFVLALPGAIALLARRAHAVTGGRGLARLAGWAILAALPFVILMGWSNLVRDGRVLSAGYGFGEPFRESLFWGLYSLFFSSGKGLFLYNPPLVFAWHQRPRLPRDFWAALGLTAAPVVLLYAKFSVWSGDWSWGPRYLLFLVAPLMVPVAVLLDDWIQRRQRVRLALFGVVAAAGLCVQLLGAGVYWDYFIRLAQAGSTSWLGAPNRGGAYKSPQGGHCDPCFEDLYGHTYLPAFQPIEGHYWLIKHRLRGDRWDDAVADAPWRRYTDLPLEATRKFYPWPPLDFWYVPFSARFGAAARLLMLAFVLGTAGGGALWVRALRPRRASRG
jgi:hypothetical protein